MGGRLGLGQLKRLGHRSERTGSPDRWALLVELWDMGLSMGTWTSVPHHALNATPESRTVSPLTALCPSD